MLIHRILSTFGLIVFCAIAIYILPLFNLGILVITALALYEFFSMLEKKGISIYKYVGIGLGVLIPASIMFQFRLTRGWELFFIVMALLFLIMMQFKRRQSSGVVVGISTTIFAVLYVSWFFSFLVRIRMLDGGAGLVAACLLMTKLTDIGAYLVGSRFGRHPLIPRVSPKKSIEGALGGLLFGALAGLAAKGLMPDSFSYMHMALIGVCIGILGQLGDLSESLMKRDCGIKDSAAVIPGIGGVLDLIDSVLFTAPVFYFYITLKTFNF